MYNTEYIANGLPMGPGGTVSQVYPPALGDKGKHLFAEQGQAQAGSLVKSF